ncbi:MAG: hypothetical protein VKJ46_16065 [Leptolyngbyaceae bacterium]|nr:hypothetical protein [Leptolyngbyaceae bacterium]
MVLIYAQRSRVSVNSCRRHDDYAKKLEDYESLGIREYNMA